MPPGAGEWLCFLAEPLMRTPPDGIEAQIRLTERPLPEGWRA